MGYVNHKSTPPRSVQVILGGAMAIFGLLVGGIFATPDYHRALTMGDQPNDMTWQELVDNGIGENSYIRLVDVQIDDSNPMSELEGMLGAFDQKGLDSDASPEETQAAFEQAAKQFDFGRLARMTSQPIKVYPRGANSSTTPARIVVPRTCSINSAAEAEIRKSHTLTGRFTLAPSGSTNSMMQELLISGIEQAAQQQDEELRRRLGKMKDADSEEHVDPALAQNDGKADQVQYVYSPVHGTAGRQGAFNWFMLCFLAVTFGLVICGSGGPSLICCLFFHGPSTLSLIGYPMRYGRATKGTRILYAGVGIVLIAYGYQAFVDAKFGQMDGDVPRSMLGFWASSIGAAALLGAFTNFIAVRMSEGLEPDSFNHRSKQKTKLSAEAVCSVEPVDANEMVLYADAPLATTDVPKLSEPMRSIADCLIAIDFGQPQLFAWEKGLAPAPTLIQLGCKDMVVVDADEHDGETLIRMVSVLHDGMAVVTVSSTVRTRDSRRLGTNGLYTVANGDDALKMLSTHLRETVELAEKRSTELVSFHSSEAVDVTMLGRRVLASIRSQYGEEIMDVGDANYGRLGFPIRPIAMPALV